MLRPRYPRAIRGLSLAKFRAKYGGLQPDEERSEKVRVNGRVTNVRKASSRLMFVDIVDDGTPLQLMCNARRMELLKTRRGDVITALGLPSRSSTGELSLVPEEMAVLSPCLKDIPLAMKGGMQNRVLDMLVNSETTKLLRLRSDTIRKMREFFHAEGFTEVQTPLLAASAGGALAKPFKTTATEFRGKQLELRIAPELWLKRLVVGGLERVFEIGPVFRNEGIDATHNPEFTTCEFYQAHADLETLIQITERLLAEVGPWKPPFRQLDFLQTLEIGLGVKLPDLEAPDALDRLAKLAQAKDILPGLSLTQLLDTLAGIYIEPLCDGPTLIMNHPAVMSPLAKSFERDGQQLSARFELFIDGKELVNAYEEENSPDEQRRKFERQGKVDESYVQALEYGLPPTGGWGMGIDRLVMLLGGASRIEEVLPFGNLRHVIGNV